MTETSQVVHDYATDTNQATEIASLASIDTKVATAANQTTEITKLTSIDGKTPALGQALAAASVPVVLPAAQITTLTPPTTVTVIQPTGTNLHTTVDNFPATQPISAVSLPLPSGASTSANQVTANASLAAIDAGVPAALGQTTKVNSMPVVLASDYQVPVVSQIVNSPLYEDMNALTGGVARGTNLTTTYANIYSYTGSGLFYGFRTTFQTLNIMQIRILIDGVDYLMGATGMSLADAAAAALYNFATAVPILGIEIDGNSFTFQPPSPLKFTASLVVKASVISGAAKQFLAGFAVRSA